MNQMMAPEFKKVILTENASLGIDHDGELWIIGGRVDHNESTMLNITPGDDPAKIMHKTTFVSGLKNQLGLGAADEIHIVDALFRIEGISVIVELIPAGGERSKWLVKLIPSIHCTG